MDPVLSAELRLRCGDRLIDARGHLAALLRRLDQPLLAGRVSRTNPWGQPAAAEREFYEVAEAEGLPAEVRATARLLGHVMSVAQQDTVDITLRTLDRLHRALHDYRATLVTLVWVDPRGERVVSGTVMVLADALADLEKQGHRLAGVSEACHGRIHERPWSISRRLGGLNTVSVSSGIGTVEADYRP